MNRFQLLLPYLSALVVALCCVCPAFAQPLTGTIQGRVFNPANGRYILNARVSVDGGKQETFTDSFGQYRLFNTPVGTVKLRVEFTGFPSREAIVQVVAGETTKHDFELTPDGTSDDAITLDPFVVQASRERNAAAIAVNEQRYASNFKSVVSTDQFGNVPDGNAGDFIKFLPGVSVTYAGGEVTSISVGGLPASATPIFMGGSPVAGAGTGPDRSAGVGFSVNNMARIEVTKSPTPDLPASAIGGSVNLVPKSAFERAKPELVVKSYLTARSDEMHLAKSPGPGREPTRKIHPAGELSYVAPLRENLGVAIGILLSKAYTNQDQLIQNWLPSSGPVPNNGIFPTTTYDKPYATQFQIFDAPKVTDKKNFGITTDWKPFRDLVLTAGVQFNDTYAYAQQRRWVVATNGANPGEFGPTFTHARAGRNVSASQQLSASFAQDVEQFMPTVKFRYTGRQLEMEGGWAYSKAHTQYYDIDKGFFRNMDFRRVNLTVNLDGVSPREIPSAFTTFDASGNPVDVRDGTNLFLNSVTTQQLTRDNTIRHVYANATRTFRLVVPIRTKVGFDISEQIQDTYAPVLTWTYLGPDRLAPNTTNGSTDFGTQTRDNYFGPEYIDQSFSTRILPFGGGSIKWMNQYKIYELFRDHPEYFTPSNATTDRQSIVNNSTNIRERVFSGYIRGDTKLLNDRLGIVAGVRWEQTRDLGVGPLTDLNAKYQKNPDGSLVDSNPNVAGVQPVFIPNWTSLTLAEQNALLYVIRGARTKKTYADFYPSVNAVYEITRHFRARASWAQTIARPNFNNIVPSLGFSEPSAATPVITVNNPNLVPWTANSYIVGLEYYFDRPSAGLLSVRARRIDIKNFFSSLRYPTVESASSLLGSYGLDPADFPDYQVQTTVNLGDAQITGVDAEYRQNLGFLPHWARGISLFGTVTVQHVEGSNLAAFGNSGFPKKNGSWGFTITRPRFTFSSNWNYRGKQRATPITGTGIPGPEADTYAYDAARLYLDLSLDLRLTKRLTLFGYARNVTNQVEEVQRYGPSTPEYAKVYSIQEFGTYYTFGLKATF